MECDVQFSYVRDILIFASFDVPSRPSPRPPHLSMSVGFRSPTSTCDSQSQSLTIGRVPEAPFARYICVTPIQRPGLSSGKSWDLPGRHERDKLPRRSVFAANTRDTCSRISIFTKLICGRGKNGNSGATWKKKSCVQLVHKVISRNFAPTLFCSLSFVSLDFCSPSVCFSTSGLSKHVVKSDHVSQDRTTVEK